MIYKAPIKNSILLILILAGMASFTICTIYGFSIFHQSKYTIKNEGKLIDITLRQKGKTDFILHADVYEDHKFVFNNTWPLPYMVFRLDTGDVNNDHSTDILVGVIKSTRFDPISRKRLFIFKLFEGYIRPLWLGSRVSQPLIDFKYYKSKKEGVVRTIELEKDQLFLIAEYHWNGFGLGFIHYLAREKTYCQATKILNTIDYEITN